MVSEEEGQEILVISRKAHVIRVTLEDFRVTGRDTQGVIIWKERMANDQVASIACFSETMYGRAEDESDDSIDDSGDDSQNGHHPTNGAAESGAVASAATDDGTADPGTPDDATADEDTTDDGTTDEGTPSEE